MSLAENDLTYPQNHAFSIDPLEDPDGWFCQGWQVMPWCKSWKTIYDSQERLFENLDDPILLDESVLEFYFASEKSLRDIETRMLGDRSFLSKYCTRKLLLRLARRHATIQVKDAVYPNWHDLVAVERKRRELYWQIAVRYKCDDPFGDNPIESAGPIGPEPVPPKQIARHLRTFCGIPIGVLSGSVAVLIAASIAIVEIEKIVDFMLSPFQKVAGTDNRPAVYPEIGLSGPIDVAPNGPIAISPPEPAEGAPDASSRLHFRSNGRQSRAGEPGNR